MELYAYVQILAFYIKSLDIKTQIQRESYVRFINKITSIMINPKVRKISITSFMLILHLIEN